MEFHIYVQPLLIPFQELFESYDPDDSDYDAFDEWDNRYRELLGNIFNDVIAGKTEQPWSRIPIEPVKRIWMEYAQYKIIRHEKMEKLVDKMGEIAINNIIKLYLNTMLSGHTELNPEDEAEEQGYCFKEKIQGQEEEEQQEEQQKTYIEQADPTLFPVQYHHPEHKQKAGDFDKERQCMILPFTYDKFNELTDVYIYDKDWGQWRISDYAMKPLMELAHDLLKADSAEEKMLLLDRVFNVVHPRGDIASLFVVGGSKALTELAELPGVTYAA